MISHKKHTVKDKSLLHLGHFYTALKYRPEFLVSQATVFQQFYTQCLRVGCVNLLTGKQFVIDLRLLDINVYTRNEYHVLYGETLATVVLYIEWPSHNHYFCQEKAPFLSSFEKRDILWEHRRHWAGGR